MSNRRIQQTQANPSSPAYTTDGGFVPPMSLPDGMTWWEMLLPPTAAPLLALLLVVVPIVLLSAESLLIPLFEWMKDRFTLSPADALGFGELPPHFFLKLITFAVLAFLGSFQLLLRIKTIYYGTWAKAFPRPHPLHVDYQSNSERGMIALIQWKLFQIALIVLPPLVMASLTVMVGMVMLYLFNTFNELSFVGLSVQFTVELFLILMLGMFTGLAFLNSLWVAITSLFGDVIAVTEPDLPNPLVMQRCNRIAFASKYTLLLIPGYLLLTGWIIAQIVWLLNDVEIHQFNLAQLGANLPLLATMAALEIFTVGLYLLFSFFKFYTYHHGLALYYHRLPEQLKDCFSPPPPASHLGFDSADDAEEDDNTPLTPPGTGRGLLWPKPDH